MSWDAKQVISMIKSGVLPPLGIDSVGLEKIEGKVDKSLKEVYIIIKIPLFGGEWTSPSIYSVHSNITKARKEFNKLTKEYDSCYRYKLKTYKVKE